jgi:hypothetical protein
VARYEITRRTFGENDYARPTVEDTRYAEGHEFREGMLVLKNGYSTVAVYARGSWVMMSRDEDAPEEVVAE